MNRAIILRFNQIISATIVIICVYVLLTPLLPELGYQDLAPELQAALVDQARAETILGSPAEEPTGNRLVIPKIGVSGEVHEGYSVFTLNSGIWRRPHSSTPDKGSNTVFVAHRYDYGNDDRSFYHLPKLEEGDEIYVFWDEVEYHYTVVETSIVESTEVEIEDPTEEDILTLYTCTPLWTSINRFVVKAVPTEQLDQTT